jgi:hypothetical protein
MRRKRMTTEAEKKEAEKKDAEKTGKTYDGGPIPKLSKTARERAEKESEES